MTNDERANNIRDAFYKQISVIDDHFHCLLELLNSEIESNMAFKAEDVMGFIRQSKLEILKVKKHIEQRESEIAKSRFGDW